MWLLILCDQRRTYTAPAFNFLAQPPLLTLAHPQDIDSPVGRLLRCVRANTYNSTRVATFAALTGLSPDGTVWSPDTWHFLLQLLNALRMLLAGTWRTTLRAWGTSPNGAPIPIQAVYDLVGNLYNVQVRGCKEKATAEEGGRSGSHCV